MNQYFVGLVPGEVTIADLSLIITEGEVVAIATDKALSSRDLWRAVNQSLLARVRRGLPLEGGGPPVDTDVQDRLAVLEREKADLQAQVEGLREHLARTQAQVGERDAEIRILQGLVASKGPAPDPRFDQMLTLLTELQSRPAVVTVGVPAAPSHVHVQGGSSSSSDVPIFLPTFEKPEGGRVTVTESTQQGGTESAREALRRIKQGR
jgi:hypothetical protein